MYSEQCYKLGSNRSAIRELFEYGKQRAAIVGKENVYDFSLGNPTIPAPACVKEAIVELLETTSSMEVHGYTSAQGDAELREALAQYYNNTYGTKFHADNYYITCGAAASLCISFRALTESKEDEFIAIAPFFPEYRVFVEGNGAKLRVVKPDTENFQINMKELEEAINEHTKGVIINSPNNPSGVIYSKETIEKLAALLEAKSKELGRTIFLISDEPYREIAYDGVEVPYVTKYYANTIVCYSYSKSLSLPGERIGFVLVPDEVTDSRNVYYAMCGAARALGFVCAPSMFQKVLIKCLGQVGDINLYKTNRDILYKGLTELGFECVKPQGAFYMFVKAMGGDSAVFCEKAKALDLLLVAADGFGCPGYVRISYCVDKEMIERSMNAFKKLAEQYI
ncbi:MAG: pyridoxal phosphate-dependent aminotransferase [Lachnospiraceae bacterium]|nr:pyridoxal phosphate-dependent aminotransferase [Lachnospiraceae bacterium]